MRLTSTIGLTLASLSLAKETRPIVANPPHYHPEFKAIAWPCKVRWPCNQEGNIPLSDARKCLGNANRDVCGSDIFSSFYPESHVEVAPISNGTHTLYGITVEDTWRMQKGLDKVVESVTFFSIYPDRGPDIGDWNLRVFSRAILTVGEFDEKTLFKPGFQEIHDGYPSIGYRHLDWRPPTEENLSHYHPFVTVGVLLTNAQAQLAGLQTFSPTVRLLMGKPGNVQ